MKIRWRWARPGDYILLTLETEHGPQEAGVFVEHDACWWNKRGPVKAWDGDLDAPTLDRSILVQNRAGKTLWHGHLIRGELVA